MAVAGPRIELGLSLEDAAKAIGIARQTLARYEINPLAVGEARRALIASFYRDLRAVRERARARRTPEDLRAAR